MRSSILYLLKKASQRDAIENKPYAQKLYEQAIKKNIIKELT